MRWRRARAFDERRAMLLTATSENQIDMPHSWQFCAYVRGCVCSVRPVSVHRSQQLSATCGPA